jgi:hypothetical protein
LYRYDLNAAHSGSSVKAASFRSTSLCRLAEKYVSLDSLYQPQGNSPQPRV